MTARPASIRFARLVGVLVALSAVSAGSPLAAQPNALQSFRQEPHGFVVDMPSDRTYSRRNGLRLHVDSRWPNNFGYRPFRIELLSEKPTKVEHRLTIRLHVVSWDRPAGHLCVEQKFDMPLGATSAKTVIACPQFEAGQHYWWEVWVDGILDKELGAPEAAAWQISSTASSNNTAAALKFLMVGGTFVDQKMIGSGSDVFEALVVALEELPTRWIDYSAVDVVALAPRDLAKLAATRPAALEALRRWNRAGGQLWINPVGDEWEQLSEVEQLLKLSPPQEAELDSAEAIANSATALVDRGWKPIKFVADTGETSRAAFRHLITGRIRVSRNPIEIAELKQNPDYAITEEVTTSPDGTGQSVVVRPENAGPTDSSNWYLQRQVGLGYVRIFREQWDPVGFGISWRMLLGATPYDMSSMPTPLTAAMDTTQTWEMRHGLAPNSANEDFANLLVPGVGLAPVTEFRVLITLFVLVIGPLNYWLLKRTHRLHLMLITVPAVAVALTGGLFAYAMVSDGLATKVRVRSLTTLDQSTGEAACWARLSYYAGLAPGRGLTLPDDVTLYPIMPGWNTAGSGAAVSAERLLNWTDDEQHLSEGWLRSRTPTQYLSIRARQSPHRLELKSAGDGMTARNELGTPIEFVAVVDEHGDLFVGSALATGATVELQPSTHDVAVGKLRRLVTDHRPEPPPALEDDQNSFARMQRRQQRRYFRNQFGMDYGVERLSGNLQSDAIEALVANNVDPIDRLPPRSYVAVTETGPEVVLGAPAAEEASFHVLLGTW